MLPYSSKEVVRPGLGGVFLAPLNLAEVGDGYPRDAGEVFHRQPSGAADHVDGSSNLLCAVHGKYSTQFFPLSKSEQQFFLYMCIMRKIWYHGGMDNRQELGKAIRQARLEQGMTQTELADKAGVTRRTVSNIEIGATTGQARVRQVLCEALGIDPARAIAGDDYSVKALLRAIEPLLEAVPANRRAQVMSEIVQILSTAIYQESPNLSDQAHNLPAGTRPEDFYDNYDLAADQHTEGDEVDYDSYN